VIFSSSITPFAMRKMFTLELDQPASDVAVISRG